MSKRSHGDSSRSDSYQKLFEVLAQRTSNLYGLVGRRYEEVLEIRFKHRGGNDWLVVIKRYGDDGRPEVMFANAFDFVAAILAADSALNSGKWREDKPWKDATS